MNKRNIANFLITKEFLATILQLPETIKIIGTEWDFSSDSIRIHIENEDGNILDSIDYGERSPNILPEVLLHVNNTVTRNFKSKNNESN